jgi:hypothetical protein
MAMFEKIRRDPCSMEKTIRLPPYSPETQGRQREGESGRISKEALARASGAGTREHPLLDKGILSPTEFPWPRGVARKEFEEVALKKTLWSQPRLASTALLRSRVRSPKSLR